jgi:hypothetical protein
VIVPELVPHALDAADEGAGSHLVNRLEEFEPIAVRVLAVKAPHPREVIIEEDGSPNRAKPGSPDV